MMNYHIKDLYSPTEKSPTFLRIFFSLTAAEVFFLSPHQSVSKFWEMDKISLASFHCIQARIQGVDQEDWSPLKFYNQSLLSYFSFISFFNYYLKMVILIVYLTLKGFASVFGFIYANISLFQWVYFASFFDHYIEQNSCSKSVLNELKYACKSVLFLVNLQAIGLQLY